MINCVIVDDERIARARVKKLLEIHLDQINIIGEADNGTKAIQLINNKKPELIFLDIQMPDMSGFEMLSLLSYQPKIIFTTAYSEYAIKAFENFTIDYLVKPISQDRFDKAIEKLTKLQGSTQAIDLVKLQELISQVPKKKESFSFAVRKGERIVLLDYEDITYFKAEDKYVNIYLNNSEVHITDKTLSDLDSILPQDFIRIHRSIIVNKTFVGEIEKYFKGTMIVFLNDKKGTKLKSSEKYSKELKRSLGL